MTKRETAEYPRVAAYPGPIVVTIRQAGNGMWDVNFNGMCGTVAPRAEALAEIERVLVERDRARGADASGGNPEPLPKTITDDVILDRLDEVCHRISLSGQTAGVEEIRELMRLMRDRRGDPIDGMSVPTTEIPTLTPEQREAMERLLWSVVEHEPTSGARIVRNPHQADVLIDALSARVAELERRMGQDPRPIDLAYGDALKARLAEVEAERDELRSKLGASLLARDDLLFWVQLAIRRLGEDGGGETTINNARGVLERALGRHAPKPGPETVAWAERLNLAVSNGSRGGPKGSA